MDYTGIATIMSTGGGWGILLGFIITGGIGSSYVLKFYFEIKKERAEREERYRAREESKMEQANQRHIEFLDTIGKLNSSVEALNHRLEENDWKTNINIDHIIDLAEGFDEKHGTEKRKKFVDNYLGRGGKNETKR